jgi:hypothetical protein
MVTATVYANPADVATSQTETTIRQRCNGPILSCRPLMTKLQSFGHKGGFRVNTQRTSMDAESPIRSATTRRSYRRVSKLAQLRVKVATIVMAVVLFFASLTSIAVYNPGIDSETAVPVTAQQITIVKPEGSNTVVMAPPPSLTAVRPRT